MQTKTKLTTELDIFPAGKGRINEELALAMLNFMEQYPKAIAMEHWARETDITGCKVCYAGLAALLIGCPLIIKVSELNDDGLFWTKSAEVGEKLGLTRYERDRLFIKPYWPPQYSGVDPVDRFSKFLLTGV